MDNKNTNICFNCKRWKNGICESAKFVDKDVKPSKGNFGVYVNAWDYCGLYFEVRTDKEFGCIRFTQKQFLKKG